MTRREALREAVAVLRSALPGTSAPAPSPAGGPSTQGLDASLLLASTLGISREALLSSGAEQLSEEDRGRFMRDISLRAAGRPVAYLRGRKEFWGRDFAVDGSVLVPRPDTELLVELCLAIGDRLAAARGRPPAVHECCAGSGAIAVSLAAERPDWPVSASELSASALGVARANAASLLPSGRPGGDLDLFPSDLLAAARGPFDLIVANPPYVESALAAELAASWGEPLLALDGGVDGLDLLGRLVGEAPSRLEHGGFLVVEADPGQAPLLRRLFLRSGFAGVETRRDLAGLERATLGNLP